MRALSNQTARARGTSVMEYGLIVAVIVTLALGLVVVIGNSSATPLSQVQNVLASSTPGAPATGVTTTPTPIPAPPVAHFTFTVSSSDPHSITFTDNSTGAETSRTWYVDGINPGPNDPTLTVTLASGTHSAYLEAIGPGGQNTFVLTPDLVIP